MKRILTLLTFVLLLAACGSTSEVGTGSGDLPEEGTVGVPEDPIPVEPDDRSGDGAGSLPLVDADDHVITNDVIVDPRVVVPTEIVINPDDERELWVRFVGGDPNCTAASGTLITETEEVIQIELLVGITEDALARSCQAGDFNLRVDVSVRESAVSKRIDFVQPTDGDGPLLVTPDLTTDDFLGLSVDEAAAIVEENILTARTVRIDDEAFAVTEDFNPGRLNFEVDDGQITNVTLG